MTPAERKLFREQVIREYRLKQASSQEKQNLYNSFVQRVKKIVPVNIAVGIAACVVLVSWKGWDDLAVLFISAIIWMTVVGTVLSAFLKAK